MLWLLSLLNDAMLLAATVPLAETLDAVADAKREEIAAAPERAAGLGMVRWPLGRGDFCLLAEQKMLGASAESGRSRTGEGQAKQKNDLTEITMGHR